MVLVFDWQQGIHINYHSIKKYKEIDKYENYRFFAYMVD